MTTDEPARLHLFERARSTWDDEAARTLMSAFPWSETELATKADLADLERRVRARFDQVDAQFDRIDARFARVDDRFARVDDRFEGLDLRLEALEERLVARIDLGAARNLRAIVVSMVAINATLAGLLLAGAQFT